MMPNFLRYPFLTLKGLCKKLQTKYLLKIVSFFGSLWHKGNISKGCEETGDEKYKQKPFGIILRCRCQKNFQKVSSKKNFFFFQPWLFCMHKLTTKLSSNFKRDFSYVKDYLANLERIRFFSKQPKKNTYCHLRERKNQNLNLNFHFELNAKLLYYKAFSFVIQNVALANFRGLSVNVFTLWQNLN